MTRLLLIDVNIGNQQQKRLGMDLQDTVKPCTITNAKNNDKGHQDPIPNITNM